MCLLFIILKLWNHLENINTKLKSFQNISEKEYQLQKHEYLYNTKPLLFYQNISSKIGVEHK